MLFLNQFVINFTGLKEGEHSFEFELNNKFFEHFDYNDFNSCRITAIVKVNKKSNLLEFSFNSKGILNINCHVSNEPFDYSIDNKMKLVVKFSSELINDNEDLLVLPLGSSQLNAAQYLFEMIILSLPIKIIHPGVEDGSLESKTLKKLKEIESSVKEQNLKNDPRWEKLKDLI
jgi:uncharacterized metal-binding protein YceD (DUF177 family)